MNTYFCETCYRRREYRLEGAERNINIHGIDISIPYTAKVCTACQQEMYDDDIEIEIMRSAQAQYRERKHMLPANDLRDYMKANSLSPEAMARRVGCAVEAILLAQDNRLVNIGLDKQIRLAMHG